MATLIKQDGTQVEIQPENGKKFRLEEAQNLVGGYIQLVSLHNKNREVIIVDEEGKYKPGYEYNPKATEIALTSGSILKDDFIVGNVVICKRKEI